MKCTRTVTNVHFLYILCMYLQQTYIILLWVVPLLVAIYLHTADLSVRVNAAKLKTVERNVEKMARLWRRVFGVQKDDKTIDMRLWRRVFGVQKDDKTIDMRLWRRVFGVQKWFLQIHIFE